MKVEIVILNYNGGDLLIDCLPSFENAIKNSKHPTKLVLLDNGSNDDSIERAEKLIANIKIVHSPENKLLC